MKELSRRSLRYRYINPFYEEYPVDPKSNCHLNYLIVCHTFVYYIVLTTIFAFPSVSFNLAYSVMFDEQLFRYPQFMQWAFLPGMLIALVIDCVIVLVSVIGALVVFIWACLSFVCVCFVMGKKIFDVIIDEYSEDDYRRLRPNIKIRVQPIREFFSKLFSRICTPLKIVD